ncbi:hypothetical protein RCK46_26760, partial [Salmonella enterica subsp. enterica serovar 1,4,[5],12:i:-]
CGAESMREKREIRRQDIRCKGTRTRGTFCALLGNLAQRLQHNIPVDSQCRSERKKAILRRMAMFNQAAIRGGFCALRILGTYPNRAHASGS